MSLTLTLLILAEAFCTLLASIRQAPDGREDQQGFKFVDRDWVRIAG